MAAPSGHAGTPRAPAPYAVRFSIGDLRQVRRAVAEWAAQAGLRGQRAGDFVTAVNEIATNAVRYGSPVARLELKVAGAAAQAEVRDSGHWPSEPARAPDPSSGGMGLPLARRVCDDVAIRRRAGGSTVILRMRLPDRAARSPGRPFCMSESISVEVAGDDSAGSVTLPIGFETNRPQRRQETRALNVQHQVQQLGGRQVHLIDPPGPQASVVTLH
jgi:serine/threonine-protein kinase RsbW